MQNSTTPSKIPISNALLELKLGTEPGASGTGLMAEDDKMADGGGC